LDLKKLQTISEARVWLQSCPWADREGVLPPDTVLGLVPTMGALHEGHLSLIRSARKHCPVVVVTIFVNPIQFGPNEDYRKYPRPIEADLEACEREGANAVFYPTAEEMYSQASSTRIIVPPDLTATLCGPHRPGHFDGVATIVAKLFHIFTPAMAFFGQKDYQQAAIIRRMNHDLNFCMGLCICPTVREQDGLAMSSRNAYLSPAERVQARSLSASLFWARDQVAAGQRDADKLVREMRERIEAAGPCRIDYVECVGDQDLSPRPRVEGRCVFALAVRIGSTRLIDNVMVDATGTKQ
jgi:pantoate--beta-alanine ligase